jgi:hypothetical protein
MTTEAEAIEVKEEPKGKLDTDVKPAGATNDETEEATPKEPKGAEGK